MRLNGACSGPLACSFLTPVSGFLRNMLNPGNFTPALHAATNDLLLCPTHLETWLRHLCSKDDPVMPLSVGCFPLLAHGRPCSAVQQAARELVRLCRKPSHHHQGFFQGQRRQLASELTLDPHSFQKSFPWGWAHLLLGNYKDTGKAVRR
jgi:hypothetical protein